MTDNDATIWKVVVNDEEQYSIWFADREPPPGWSEVWQGGAEGGVPGVHRGGLDGHASEEPQEADGRTRGDIMTGRQETQHRMGQPGRSPASSRRWNDPIQTCLRFSPTARTARRRRSRAASSTAAHAPWRPGCRTSSAAGERALLLYPPGLEFIAAFFGCLYAGVVAVPAYLPGSTGR